MLLPYLYLKRIIKSNVYSRPEIISEPRITIAIMIRLFNWQLCVNIDFGTETCVPNCGSEMSQT